MNNYNNLLSALDQLFGFEDKKKSTFRRVGQHYDERTNEHVIIIEYRVRRDKKQTPRRGSLLRYINQSARQSAQ